MKYAVFELEFTGHREPSDTPGTYVGYLPRAELVCLNDCDAKFYENTEGYTLFKKTTFSNKLSALEFLKKRGYYKTNHINALVQPSRSVIGLFVQ